MVWYMNDYLYLQIYDAGEVFGIMQYEQEHKEVEEKASPVAVLSCKVVVTRDSGLQASEQNRYEL